METGKAGTQSGACLDLLRFEISTFSTVGRGFLLVLGAVNDIQPRFLPLSIRLRICLHSVPSTFCLCLFSLCLCLYSESVYTLSAAVYTPSLCLPSLPLFYCLLYIVSIKILELLRKASKCISKNSVVKIIIMNSFSPTCPYTPIPQFLKRTYLWDFPGGAVVKNLPVSAGDTGSSPGPGRSHLPRSN